MDTTVFAKNVVLKWLEIVVKQIKNGLKGVNDKILNIIKNIEKRFQKEKRNGFLQKKEEKAISFQTVNIVLSIRKKEGRTMPFIELLEKENLQSQNIVKYVGDVAILKLIMLYTTIKNELQSFGHVEHVTKLLQGN